MSRFGSRSRPGTPAGLWLNPPGPAVRYGAQLRAPMTATVTLTADTAAHTYGAWTQVVASVGADTSMLTVQVTGIGSSGSNTATLLSIGTGAAASEVELAVVAVGSASDANGGLVFQIPAFIPSGTRIAARIQSVVTGGKTALILVSTFDVNPYLVGMTNTTLDTLGVSTATSRGTGIAASSAYTQITASTTNAYRGIMVVPSAGNAIMVSQAGTMTVAVGAAGSEQDIGSVAFNSLNTERINLFTPSYFVPVNVPSGSRISVKQSLNTTTLDATVLGIPL